MDPIRREEIRGLFTLSLLALLIIIRTNWDKMGIQPVMTVDVPFLPGFLLVRVLRIIDIVTFFWIGYAFSMILGFSDDIITSSRIRKNLRILGLAFLLVGPIIIAIAILTVVLMAYITHYYPHSVTLTLTIFTIVTIAYLILRKYRIRLVVEPKEKGE